MEKFLYIVNPVAGKGKGKKAIPVIQDFCNSNKINHKIFITEFPTHAKDIIEKESFKFDTVISVGGDGTLNEVVNGMIPGARQKLAVLPIGSGNDFVKNINISNNLLENLSIIHNNSLNNIISSDIGIINFTTEYNDEEKTHRFINSLGIGFDAFVGYLNQNNKVLSGIMSYLFAVLKGLLNYKMISTELKINDKKFNGDRLMVSIGNGVSSGGGFYLNPYAVINDGKLDISVFDSVTRRRLLWALPMALLNKLENIPEAKFYSTNNSIEIKLRNPYYIHCDGEIITDKLRSATITIRKNALKVIQKAE